MEFDEGSETVQDSDFDDGEEGDDSDEDTDEASEADFGRSDDYMDIKEQVYQNTLANLKRQLQQLKEGTHPEYNRQKAKLEQDYEDRNFYTNITKTYLIERCERDFVNEMKAAAKEYEEKKIELRESLIAEYEEKRKVIEAERHTLELNSDGSEVKPVMTRKLRRRPNDPLPVPEKRRKQPPTQLNYQLEEKEIETDLKSMNKATQSSSGSKRSLASTSAPSTSGMSDSHVTEPRIEDGKLKYEKRFFHRGQPVYVEGKDVPRFAGNIHNIGTDTISVKKISDSSKFKIFLSQLVKKKIRIERRVP